MMTGSRARGYASMLVEKIIDLARTDFENPPEGDFVGVVSAKEHEKLREAALEAYNDGPDPGLALGGGDYPFTWEEALFETYLLGGKWENSGDLVRANSDAAWYLEKAQQHLRRLPSDEAADALVALRRIYEADAYCAWYFDKFER